MKEALVKKPTVGALEVPESMIYFVFMVMFVDTMASCISTPVMPYYAQSFGVPDTWIGYLYAAWSFSATVFAPMLSSMADKWGRKRVLVTCLAGAGIANVIQGLAIKCGSFGFWIFLFGRAFSGVWASVGATCNVYITDVAGSDTLREKYLGQLAMVPIIAIMVGPGLGGGLAAAFGNNVPVMIDGLMTLFAAGITHYNMVETPAFLRSQQENSSLAKGVSEVREVPAVPYAIHIVGVVSFLGSIASQGNLSVYALFFQKNYAFNTLYMGFLFMGVAVAMLLTNVLIVPQLKKRSMAPRQMACIGGVVSSLGTVSLGASGYLGNLHVSLLAMYTGSIGGGIQMSQFSAVVASFTDVLNRGRIFGIVQTYQNCGKILGPIAATHIAVQGLPMMGVSAFMGLPFILNGGLTFVAAFGILSARKAAEPKATLTKRLTAFGDSWQDEKGSDEDILAMGRYVSQLLTERHYKWVSRRAEIELIFEQMLPQLETSDRESYEGSLQSASRTGYDTSMAGV